MTSGRTLPLTFELSNRKTRADVIGLGDSFHDRLQLLVCGVVNLRFPIEQVRFRLASLSFQLRLLLLKMQLLAEIDPHHFPWR